MNSTIVSVHFDKPNEQEIELDIVSLKTIKQFLAEKQEITFERLDFHALLYFSDGFGKHGVDFTKYLYRPGSLFFLSRYQVQQWMIDDDAGGYLILFTEDFLNRTEADRHLLFDCIEAVEEKPPLVNLDGNVSFNSALVSLYDEFHTPADTFKADLLHSQLRTLLLQLLRVYQGSKTERPQGRNIGLYFDFRRLLEKHIAEHLTVAEYASRLAVTTRKLNQTIKSHAGLTSKKVIDDRLVLEIKRHISKSKRDDNLASVAYHLGFENYTDFGKFFKRMTKKSPLRFKQMIFEEA